MNTFHDHSAAYSLDDLHGFAGPNEGVPCSNEPLHLEFIILISTCSMDGFQLEQYDLQYDCGTLHNRYTQ